MSYYRGCVSKVIGNDIEVSIKHKSVSNFKWPQKEDNIFYSLDDVLKNIDLPIPTGNRGQFKFKEDFKL